MMVQKNLVECLKVNRKNIFRIMLQMLKQD